MQPHQYLIQHTVAAEDNDPAVQADQRTGLERDHDEQQHSPFPDSVHLRHEITVWISDQRHEKGGGKCQLQRLPESIQIQRFQYSFVIVQRECKVHTPDLCSL